MTSLLRKLSRVAAGAAMLLAGGAASALPVSFTLNNGGNQNLNKLTVSIPDFGATAQSTLTGTIDTQISSPGSLPASLSAVGGEMLLSDFNLLGVLIQAKGLGVTMSGGPKNSTGGPSPIGFDLGSLFSLTLNQGKIFVNGAVNNDFSVTPVIFGLPAPTQSSMAVSPIPNGYNLVWSIPVSVSTLLDNPVAPGQKITLSVTGNVRAVGQYVVPEPGTLLLVVAGLAGLGVAGRRRSG